MRCRRRSFLAAGLGWLALDPVMAQSPIVPEGARLEKLAGGCRFTEGPACDAAGNVYFSDNPNNRIMLYTRGGELRVWKQPARSANGMMFDRQGRLITCNAQNAPDGRTVTRYERDGSVTLLASHYQGKRFNSPNDLCIDRHDRIYFTDPRYGAADDLEQDRRAVYRIDRPGEVVRVIDDVENPNGMAITPDNLTLYVADNNPAPGGARTLIAYDIRPDGRCVRRKVLHDFSPSRGIDGMRVDVAGNVYATAETGPRSGVYIFAPDGKQIGFIPTPEDATNCTWGGPDLKTLYITAGTSLYRIRLDAQGYLVYPRPR